MSRTKSPKNPSVNSVVSQRRVNRRLGSMPVVAVLAAALVVAVSCGGDTNDEPRRLLVDTHTGSDAGDVGVDGTADAVDDVEPDGTDTSPPPLAELPPCQSNSPDSVAEATSIEAGPWLLTSGANASGLGTALDKNNFEMPSAGETAYGTKWHEVSVDEDGVIDVSRFPYANILYAATRITVPEDTTYFARPDGIYNVYVGEHRQPGDLYAYGDKRVPVPLESGENFVVLEFSPSRGHAIELYESPDDVYFNTADITAPDLRVGFQNTQPVGVQMVNLTDLPLRDVEATVVENEYFQKTTVTYPALGPNAANQISWRLEPKNAWRTKDKKIPVTLRFSACPLETAYEKTIELKTVGAGKNFKRTFRSPVDGSTQYYAVVPPTNENSSRDYGLVLTLHGAGVEATGQANAYTRKEWAYIVAPTNRRRFGFNWEEWGHHNGMAALEDATGEFNIDETNVHVTGHSMGGHGAWHLGVMHPGTFATVNPSAGWGSIYTYPPGRASERPEEPVQSARAHSATRTWLPNLSDRAAFIVHGGEDDNVPTSEGRDMRDELKNYCDDVQWHEEPGAKHWWDREETPGTDCVDWPGMFELMKSRSLDPAELDFEFITPGPYYSAEHAYVTIQSRDNPLEKAKLVSTKVSATKVELTTTNVRSMTLDGDALQAKGIDEIDVGESDNVDGSGEVIYETKTVSSGMMDIGPTTGKRVGRTGPLNQAFQTPFCFIYPERPTGDFRSYVSNLQSLWSIRGNGHSCGLPANYVDQQLRDDYTLIYVGTKFETLPNRDELPFSWTDRAVSLGDSNHFDGAAAFVTFPTPDSEGKGVAAAITTARGKEFLLNRYHPFSSRTGMPDYLVFNENGGLALGFFGPDWQVNPGFGGGVQ